MFQRPSAALSGSLGLSNRLRAPDGCTAYTQPRACAAKNTSSNRVMNQPTDRPIPWEAACRWQQYEAELRVNLVRMGAVGAFYIVHLVHHLAAGGKVPFLKALGLDAGTVLNTQTHAALTYAVLAWVMIGLWIHRSLSSRVFPGWLMYASTLSDLCLLTAILVLTSGATSPLVAGYFLIVMMSGLRFDLPLVRWTTAASVFGYLIVLGCAKWPIGLSKLSPLPTVPRYQQLMMIVALLLAGVVVGQWVRQAHQLARQVTSGSDDEAQS
jgi:hypothetical protein